jgi:hypothetical protein
MSQRYSLLKQIDTSNVKNLELKWMVQNQVLVPGKRRRSWSTASCISRSVPTT